MIKKIVLAAILLMGTTIGAKAQGYVDQDAVTPVLESQGSAFTTVQAVTWHKYDLGKAGKTSKIMLQKLQAHIDSLPGDQVGHRLEIVELSNRVRTKYMVQRHTLMIPDFFPADFRAYSPYPMEYTAATSLPKLFVIDKYTQTFGAYENGKLVRWGLVSTGRNDELTPPGRYNFNWKTEYRESTEAPPGEVWKLRWVFNLDVRKGIHVHQYQLPISAPASHGCVRLTEADALWNFNWASEWVAKNDKIEKPGTPALILNYNPVGAAAHWQMGYDGSAQSLVNLPVEPMAEPRPSNYASK